MGRRRGRPPHPDILTPRQWEVLSLLRDGLTDLQIGRRLGSTRGGASWHVAEILGKLIVGSRQEAAVWQPTHIPWWRTALPAFLAWPFNNLWWGSAAKVAATAAVVASVTLFPIPERLDLSVYRQGDAYLITADNIAPFVSDRAQEGQATWSPDCSRIAFSSNLDEDRGPGIHSADYDIYVVDPNGTAAIKVGDSTHTDIAPAWSPDGTQIAFTRIESTEIEVIGPTGRPIRPPTGRGDVYVVTAAPIPPATARPIPQPSPCLNDQGRRGR